MKKIMFNDRFCLTNAVIEKRKRQTRRLVPEEVFSLHWDIDGTEENPINLHIENEFGDFVDIRKTKFARYKIGEIAAVAQCYKDVLYQYPYDDAYSLDYILHSSTGVEIEELVGYSNKMFVRADLMPHRVIFTNVRLQRLQEITDEECLLEGIGQCNGKYTINDTKDEEGYRWFDTAREAYAFIINAISGKGTWERNPYVFVYDFGLVK